MVWRATCAMEERLRFVMAAVENDAPFAVLCRRFGVSPKIGYKWLDHRRGNRRQPMARLIRSSKLAKSVSISLEPSSITR